jgi:hypothetical protein
MNGSTATRTALEAPSNCDRRGNKVRGREFHPFKIARLTSVKQDVFGDGFVHLAPRTHDISFTEGHISNIERLGADLDAAVKAVWPKRHGIKYSQVHVLLLSWEADDLGVGEEIKGLRHVFRDRFNFQVQLYQIPSLKPDKELKRRVLDFLDLDSKDTLLIVYYGGHAKRGLHSSDSPIWFAYGILHCRGVLLAYYSTEPEKILLYRFLLAAYNLCLKRQTQTFSYCLIVVIQPPSPQRILCEALVE